MKREMERKKPLTATQLFDTLHLWRAQSNAFQISFSFRLKFMDSKARQGASL